MKTFELVYTIEAASSWRNKEAIKIKSNLADDKLVDCELSQCLVDYLKTEAAVLDPDKLLLTIAEAQKREIQTSIENMDDMAIQEILSNISDEAETKYAEIEKKFSDTEKRFKDKMISTSESIKTHMEKLSVIDEKLTKIDNWSLEKLTETLKQLIKIIEVDPELVKLVLDYKKA